MKIVVRHSPNQSERIHGNDAVRLVVCHTPEGGYEGTIRYILDESNPRKVSYHALISEDGREITQLVPWHRKAWHAGPINSLSDGISAAGYAHRFDVDTKQARTMAFLVARRLIARGLKAQWTTDPAKGGFCRHADLQADRSDPTPNLAEWRVFVGMVQAEYLKLRGVGKGDWPIPVPRWFWAWARWRLQGLEGTRPKDAPRIIPLWAWRRLRALTDARR